MKNGIPKVKIKIPLQSEAEGLKHIYGIGERIRDRSVTKIERKSPSKLLENNALHDMIICPVKCVPFRTVPATG